MAGSSLITFTSDFGSSDYYAGAVKGSILSVYPEARIVDITHEVGAHDVLEGAFELLCAYSYFPCKTIHLAVVDPGVGSSRRGIIIATDNYYFVGPDNGIFSLVCSREPANRIISIESEHHFRRPVAPTFHARDIFGPVAAWMARGVQITNFGPQVENYDRLALPQVQKLDEKRLQGAILHIDKFGNIITNLSPQEVCHRLGKESPPARFILDGKEILQHHRFYSEAAPDEVFSLVGSSGYFEIAALKQSAAQVLNAKRGARIELEVE